MAKKFRVRLKEYKTNELIGNENTVEYGDLFVEHRPLGTRFLLKHGTENNPSPRALKNIVNQKGFNYVDSGLHVIDAKQFAEYLKGDVNGVKVVDLDKYTEGGFYYIRGEANTGKQDEGVILKNSPYSTDAVNGPEFAGYLQVIEWNSNHCKQIFYKGSSSRENQGFYTRTYIEGGWSEWTLLDTRENLEKEFFNLNPIVISGKPDFDSTITPGVYWFSNDSLETDFPKTKLKNGFLIVLNQGVFSKQIILRGGSKTTCNDIFIRSRHSEGWSPWLKIPVETFDL